MKTKHLLLFMVAILLSFSIRSQIGTSLNFDGTDDYISAPDPNFGNSDFTMELWVKPTALTSTELLGTRTNEFFANGGWWSLIMDNNGLTLETAEANIGSQLIVQTSNTVITTGAWHHIAVVRSGLNYIIYVNGVVQGTATDVGVRNLYTGNNMMHIGGWPDINSRYLSGSMDELRIWNVARTASDISAHAACELDPTAPHTGLLRYYRFNQGTAGGTNTGDGILIDISGNNSHAVLNGFALTGATSNFIADHAANILPVVSVTSATICNGSSVTLVGSGASTYTITGGTFSVSPSTTTSYSVTGTSTAGCISSNTAVATVSVNASPVVTVNSGSICSGSSFSIVASGAPTLAVTGNTFNVAPSASANYTVTGTDANGCTATAVSSVVVNTTPTLAVANYSVCAGGTVTIVPTGAGASGTYTITGGSFSVSPSANTNYTITGTSADGCPASNSVVSTVSVIALPTVAVTATTTICSGKSATIAPTGSGTGGSYTITGGTFTVSPSVTTSYSITATNSAGCVSSNTAVATVSVNASPVVTVNSGSICSGQSFTFNAAGAPTLAITGTNFTVTPATTTAYTVTGTAANGCTANAVTGVTVSATPTITVPNYSICAGSSATIVPAGAGTGGSYTISGGTFTVSPTATTVYSVTGTSSAGCVSAAQGTGSVVVNNTQPTVTATSTLITICAGKSATIVPAGAATYTITGGTLTVTPAATTSYSITGTTGGCVSSNTAVVTVSVNANPTVAVNSGSICSGQSFTFNATGAPTLAITGTNFTVTPTTTTAYTVTGTAANGCTANAVTGVTVSATPTITVPNYSICAGSSATIVPAGAGTGGSYTISGGTFTVSPTATTVYSVTGTSSAGCVSAAQGTGSVVVNNTQPTVTATSTLITICAGKSATIVPAGAATYTITGGTLTVTPAATTSYSITGTTGGCVSSNTAVVTVSVNANPTVAVNSGSICSGQSFTFNATGAPTLAITGTNFTVTPTTTTAYTVTGTAANGCTATAVTGVTVSASPTITVPNYTICSAGPAVTITPAGAGVNGTYSITGGSFTVNPSVATAYSVTGTNSLGCLGTNTAVSNVTPNITPTISVSNYTICSGKSATIAPTGATTYTSNSGSLIVSPTTSTNYSITGSANGCVGSNTAVTSVSVIASPTISVNSGSICSGNSFTVNASGAPTLAISGSNFTVTPATTSAYTVTGTAANGCTASAVSNVTVSATPTITAANYSVCLGKTVTVVPAGAGTGGTYTISGGSFSFAPTSASINTYSVTGTNAAGCVSGNTATLTVSSLTLPVVAVLANTTICSGSTVGIVPTGAGSYTVTGNNFTVTPLTNTSYSVTGTTNGCVSSNTAVITVSVNASPTITVNSGAICLNNSLTLVPGGANSYTVTGGTFTVSPTANTSYSVTGTGTNGCLSTVTGVSNVTVNPLPVVVVNSGAICPGNTFTFFPTGAVTYTFSNGSSTVTPTATDSYSVTGTSALGCISSNTAVSTVSVINTVSVSVFGNTSICIGESTELLANGANSYSWSTAAITETINVTPTTNTTYTVSGTTGNCTDVAIVTVTVNALPVVAVNSGTVCRGKSFTITPTGADTYTFSNGSHIITPTANTSFSVTGTSTAGCVSSNTAVGSVVVNALPNVTIASTVVCQGETANLTASGANTYSWSSGQSGATITTPTLASNTSFTVTGTDANGCSKAASVTQVTDLCTAISKLNNNISFGLYPNPNNGEFTISLEADASITVINNIGQVVYAAELTAGKNQVSLDGLNNGIYFVTLKQNNNTKSVKVIKQ